MASPVSPAPKQSPRGTALLNSLEEIFLGEGFRRVTVGELAARLHCSRTTLYALAPSKEGLFLRVLERLLARIRQRGQAAAAEQADVRNRIVAHLLPGAREMRAASGLFFSDIASLPAARKLLTDHQRARREEMAAIIDEGIRSGAFRGVHTSLVADVLLVAIQRVMDADVLAENQIAAGEAIAEIEDLFLHGLLHPPRVAVGSRRPARR